MKKKIAIAAFLIALAGHSEAALYTFTNGSGATASGIQDSSGNIFRGGTTAGTALGGTNGGTSAGAGVVAVGIFSTDDFTGMSQSQILSAFTNFDATGAFSAAAGPGNRGVFALPETQTLIAGNATFENKNLYLIVGNGTTLANSTEFLILKSTETFAAADDGFPSVNKSFTTANSTVLFGSSVTDVRTTNGDASITAGWATAPVPEPSTALLGLLGALGLLRRRR